ncbi:MAG TPA: hypothetical protein VFV46_05750, partial [Lacibacter sp.]|nr:hypothetical protein [Lacibacter sp.]
FDVLSPAETGADVPFSFLFNSERLNRMQQQQLNGGLGVDEMITMLINKTWKAARRTGTEGLIQQQTEQILLTYLLAASVDETNSYGVRSVLQKQLNELKKYMEAQQKINTSAAGHYQLALERMKAPKDAKPTIHKEIPPGAPIGCEEE